MSDGKKAVWAIANPLRPGSSFRHVSNGHGELFRPMLEPRDFSREERVAMTRDFSDFFDLGPDAVDQSANPYYTTAMGLARLLHVTCDGNNITEFFGFMMHMPPALKDLLARKDAKALLMVAYWYAKLYRYQWWLYRRGLMEGQAICMFLDKYHGGDSRLQRMLVWPKMEFGLETTRDEGVVGSSSWLSAATVLCVV